MAHDVFISYATEDKATADAVCARLEQQDVRCWIAPRDILPGMAWKASIVNAIGDSRALVLVFSAHSNASPEVAKEIALAAKRGLSIVTFRIEDVPLASALEYDLDAIHWLDAISPPLERHIELLASKLHVVLERGAGTAAAASPSAPHGQPAAHRMSSGWLAAAALVCVAASASLGWLVFRREPPAAVSQAPAPAPVVTPDPASPAAPSPRPDSPGPSGDPPRAGEGGAQPGRPRPAAGGTATQRRDATPPPDEPGARERSDGAAAAGSTAPDSGTALRVLGCWQDPRLPGVLHIRSDGTYVSGGTLTGRWTEIDAARSIVMLQFADDVGQAQLSSDGTRLTLTGSINDTLTRSTGGSELAGAWAFSNGVPVTIEAGGAVRTSALTGRWRPVDPAHRLYAVVWPGLRPSTSLSDDGQSMTLSDSRYGFSQQMQRRPCAP